MRRAIHLSEEKMRQGAGGPFGAVVVQGGNIIAEGWNMVTSTNDPTAHAEISAIRKACAVIGDFSLSGCEIYTSCEPCPMCMAAIYWARLDKVYFGNTREDAASIEFDDAFLYDELFKPHGSRKIEMKQIMASEALNAFRAWKNKKDRINY